MISIIVPVYNPKEEYLKTCIESILNQTYSDLEVILVDNKSIGNCPYILEGYKNTDNRIKLIKLEQNIGASGAVNEALKVVTGEYFIIVDSDDFLSLDACEKIDGAIKYSKSNIDVIIYGHKIYNEKEQKFDDYIPLSDIDGDVFDHSLTPSSLVKVMHKISLTWWNKCFRLSYIKEQHLALDMDLKYVLCDVLFSIKCLLNARSILIIPNQLYSYRTNNETGVAISGYLNPNCTYWDAPIIFAKKIIEYIKFNDVTLEQKLLLNYLVLLNLFLSSDFGYKNWWRVIKYSGKIKLLLFLHNFQLKKIKKTYPNKFLYSWVFYLKYTPLSLYLYLKKKGLINV